jgi:hypothetical protein
MNSTLNSFLEEYIQIVKNDTTNSDIDCYMGLLKKDIITRDLLKINKNTFVILEYMSFYKELTLFYNKNTKINQDLTSAYDSWKNQDYHYDDNFISLNVRNIVNELDNYGEYDNDESYHIL